MGRNKRTCPYDNRGNPWPKSYRELKYQRALWDRPYIIAFFSCILLAKSVTDWKNKLGSGFKPKWSRGKEPRSGAVGLKPTFIEGGLPNDIWGIEVYRENIICVLARTGKVWHVLFQVVDSNTTPSNVVTTMRMNDKLGLETLLRRRGINKIFFLSSFYSDTIIILYKWHSRGRCRTFYSIFSFFFTINN